MNLHPTIIHECSDLSTSLAALVLLACSIFSIAIHLWQYFIIFLKNLKKFLFLPVSGLSCSMRDHRCGIRDLLLHHVGSSLGRVVFSLVVECGFSLLQLRRASSVLVALGLSCPAAHGILVSRLNPLPLHCRTDSIPVDHQGSPSLPF